MLEARDLTISYNDRVAVSDVTLALDPGDARRVRDRHGLIVEERNDSTWHVQVPAPSLEHPATAAAVVELIQTAIDRSFRGPRWTRGLDASPKSRGELCDIHFVERSVSGECPMCD